MKFAIFSAPKCPKCQEPLDVTGLQITGPGLFGAKCKKCNESRFLGVGEFSKLTNELFEETHVSGYYPTKHSTSPHGEIERY